MLIVAVRTFIMYIALLFAIRLMGNSELSKMSPFQLVVVFMIAELAAIPIDSTSTSLLNGIMAIFTLAFFQILISFISTKSETIKMIFSGKPILLVEKGKLNYKELSKQRITLTDLMEQLRIQNCPSICDVDYAVLESNGNLSVIKKNEGEVLPSILISDGHLYPKNLKLVNLTKKKLEKRLSRIGINSFSEVFLAFCDESKKLHIYTIDDAAKPFTKEQII